MTPAGSVGGDARLRLFLALELPPATLDVLVRWGAEHLAGGRIVPREHLHVTLAFLGSRPADELDAIVGALRTAVEAVSETIRLEPVAWRETSSVGMVVLDDRTGEATRLAGHLHGSLAELGVYLPESRPWLPHVTVLRFRERPRLDPPLPGTGTFVPSDAAAYLSRLHPTGARYAVLERVSLNAGG
ncbi:MAG: RNA 2',3'-cyclic phosphodiesterase [Gaiella sp.]|nr:RNA 2',3'-cyclic phosphodiesterase [Gaiella sp.]